MYQRFLLEFAVEVPNSDVAGDVVTRLSRENFDRMRDTIASVTGFQPLRAPGAVGYLLAHEPVTWNDKEKDWIGPDDLDDDDE
jgi:hypothetical protein